MRNTGRLLAVLVMIALVGVFMGCSSMQMKKSVPESEYSGFLKDYPPMQKGAEGIDERWLKPGVDFGKYDMIMMDEVVFFFHQDADYKGIKPSEIQELGEDFHKAFIQEMGDLMTSDPGPNVIRMRPAITDIVPSKPVAGSLTTVVPVGLAVSLVKKGVTGSYTGIGSATMEVEFLDSTTNERVAVGIDKAPGGKFDVGKYSAAKDAFKFWAERLHTFMQQSSISK